MNRGYITLISVLVAGAVGVAITVSVILLGVGSSKTSFSIQQASQARGLAQLCAEEALQQIRNSTSFTGTDTISSGQGTCTYTVTSQGGQNRTIQATGTVGTVVQRLSIVIDKTNPTIQAVSWQEVSNF